MKPRFITLSVSLLCSLFSLAQTNLVPNPSFEDTIGPTCGSFNWYNATVSCVLNWYRPTNGSPDYFSQVNFGVPNNSYGIENARTGIAYAGMATGNAGSFREYLQTQLLTTLIANKIYCVTFYVSLSDSSMYSTNNIGAYFSLNPDTNYTMQTNLSNSPQVENDTFLNPLNNKSGWTIVSKNFVANGGENYITIGNFKDDANSSIQYNGVGFLNVSYYYLLHR